MVLTPRVARGARRIEVAGVAATRERRDVARSRTEVRGFADRVDHWISTSSCCLVTPSLNADQGAQAVDLRRYEAERSPGIAPGSLDWQTSTLLLSYDRSRRKRRGERERPCHVPLDSPATSARPFGHALRAPVRRPYSAGADAGSRARTATLGRRASYSATPANLF
jgi:hypothetical protein